MIIICSISGVLYGEKMDQSSIKTVYGIIEEPNIEHSCFLHKYLERIIYNYFKMEKQC